MSDQKCVVEGCNLEYDVVCSFSFYNVNTASESDNKRQEWIEGAMAEESECLWRHVSLQLCGYHFELDTQGLWIDSPMLPELLTLQKHYRKPTQADKEAYEQIQREHDYLGPEMKEEKNDSISRLNVRQLVDTLGYLSLKNLKRKQLWVVKVETDKSEASITQSEQVVSKMPDPKQVIEIIPQASSSEAKYGESNQTEVLQMMDDTTISDNFIYEIAEEQEISMDEVKEIPMSENQEWMVNIIPEETKPKYAYIKHTSSGKKKRHFTSEMDEITLHGDFDNYYILPDVDPSVGVEITTSYEPENYIVEEYEHLVIENQPRKRSKDTPDSARKRKKKAPGGVREQVKEIQIKTEIEPEDWNIDSNVVYEQDGSDDYDDKKGRVRRKNKKYLGYDFVT